MSTETTNTPPAQAAAPQTSNLPAKAPPREIRVVEDDGPLAYLLDTARFEHIQRISALMAMSSLSPAHLRGSNFEEGRANCFRVVNQALRWGLDPFAVADASYLVYGKLGYEGKLIAGVVNARAGLRGPLNAIYNSKKGDEFACVVYGSKKAIDDGMLVFLEAYAEAEDSRVMVQTPAGEVGVLAINKLTLSGVMASRLTFREGVTFEKDGRTVKGPWQKNVAQKLFYSCVTKWARRWMPEILLGVMTEDDIEKVIEGEARLQALPEGRVSLKPNGNGSGPAKAPEQAPSAPPPAVGEVVDPPTAGEAPSGQWNHDDPPRDAGSLGDLISDLSDKIDQANTEQQLQDLNAELVRRQRELGAEYQPLATLFQAKSQKVRKAAKR